MQDVGALFESLIDEHVVLRQIKIPLYSSVTGEAVLDGTT